MKYRIKPELVKAFAQERGLDMDTLARASGVRFSTVQNIMRGRTSNPTIETIYPIAQALGVSIEALISVEVEEGQ